MALKEQRQKDLSVWGPLGAELAWGPPSAFDSSFGASARQCKFLFDPLSFSDPREPVIGNLWTVIETSLRLPRALDSILLTLGDSGAA